MTHDELLAKIGNPIDEGYEYGDIVFNKALRAVVELHKPVKDEWIDYVTCSACRVGDDDYYSPEYPCGTIEAIIKELE